MRYVPAELGINTADAERISLRYEEGSLTLALIDWQKIPRTVVFDDALAFRWQELDEPEIRDDMAHEVCESPWLRRHCENHAVSVELYAHYRLCFNACGSMLDVVARRL